MLSPIEHERSLASETSRQKLASFLRTITPALLDDFLAHSPEGIQYVIMAPISESIPESEHLFWEEEGPDGELRMSVGGERIKQLGVLNVAGSSEDIAIECRPKQEEGRGFLIRLGQGKLAIEGDVSVEELNRDLPPLFTNGELNRDRYAVHFPHVVRSLYFYNRDGTRKNQDEHPPEDTAEHPVHPAGVSVVPRRRYLSKSPQALR